MTPRTINYLRSRDRMSRITLALLSQGKEKEAMRIEARFFEWSYSHDRVLSYHSLYRSGKTVRYLVYTRYVRIEGKGWSKTVTKARAREHYRLLLKSGWMDPEKW